MYVHVRAYCSAASLKVHRILCPTSQNSTYIHTYVCACTYVRTYICICTYMCKCCAVTMLFALFLYTLEGYWFSQSVPVIYIRTYYLVPSTPLLCTLLDSIRTTDMDQLHTNIHTYTCVAVHICTQGCAQSVSSWLPPPSLLSQICDYEQLAALELERADSAREESSQLRWDLQEAQQALAQRSNDYEVRHIRTYVCMYIHTYIHQAVSCYSTCNQCQNGCSDTCVRTVYSLVQVMHKL